MVKWQLYLLGVGALAAAATGIWFHGRSTGIESERTKWEDAIEEARAADAREIERLRDIVQQRRRVVTKTVEVIRNVTDESPCQCFDAPAPDAVVNSMLATYNALFRPEIDGALSVCRVPLACDPPYNYRGALRAMADGEGVR